ncbi:hypothetical protein CHS0354_020893 [Potamilus streckersoni]|uniref:UDENN domain-containing protein n=1 Tax=Potamilus streckersoni TaxID=2493646 RepID=A0AAE0SW54_9BIVA|nr:hypothetical protein CHS0354_020893 [Potamilus streckersoni]
MNRQRNSKYLTSVRSLPPGKMADIRKKYEGLSSPSRVGYNAVKSSPPRRPPPPRPRKGFEPLEIQMESRRIDHSETELSQTPQKLLKNQFLGRDVQEEETLNVELRGSDDRTNVSHKEGDVFYRSDMSPDVITRLSCVSVAQKTKMFESEISKRDPSPNSSKFILPTKPLPPARQRSKCDSSSSDKDTKDEMDASFIHDPSHKPVAPMKPPRTHAHDEYVKAKMVSREQTESAIGTNLKSSPVYLKIQKKETTLTNDASQSNNSTAVSKGFLKLLKPKPRPFSVATDTFKYEDVKVRTNYNSYLTEHSDEEDENVTDDLSEIRHWDLPRQMYPEPSSMRKSVSAECLHQEEDGVDTSMYDDPNSYDDMEVYLDSSGYAVPNKFQKKFLGNSSSLETDGKQMHVRRKVNPMRTKIQRFKNLFRPESPKRIKNKLEIVKQKINQAFGSLQDWGRAHTSESREEVVNDTSTDSRSGEDEDNDSRVDDAEIKKRKEHCGSVRIKTSASIRQSRKKQEVLYPQLFEYAVIVGLQLNTEKQEYEPYIIYKFPEIAKLHICSHFRKADSNISVPHFCFPDASNYKPTSSSSNKSQYFSFVLTNFDGGRVYGYCRRIMCSRSGGKFPEVICIISPVDAFQMYNSLLEHIEKRRAVSLDHAQELIAAAFGRPLPNPGYTLHIKSLDEEGEMQAIFINRPADTRMSNVNWECLLTNLGVDKLIKVFSCILLERSVLFAAKHLGVLSPTIHALASLLYPFSWQHTFIPVLPSQMIDVVCSPVPYIIGITSSQLQKALSLPIEELLVVDLDKKTLLRTQGDEGTLIPKKMQKALKSALNMYKIDADAKSCQSLMIAEAFIRFFLEAVGHYGDYITVQGGQPKFNKEEFVSNAPSPGFKQLLEWFTETQMFEVFISTQLEKKDWGSTIEYFQTRITEFKSEIRARRSGISSGMT